MPKIKTDKSHSKWSASGGGNTRRPPARRNRHEEPASSGRLTEFCQRLRLSDSIDLACRLARETFKLDGPITVDYKTDPETFDEWASVSVTAKGEIEAIADAYDAYTSEWLRQAPEHARGKVRLSLVVE